MFFWNLISDFFSYFGLIKKPNRLVFLGLDNAGKTTLLNMLRYSKYQQSPPTMHPISGNLYFENTNFTVYDLGGHHQVRKVWKEYLPAVNAVIFLIDVWDRNRFNDCKAELDFLLTENILTKCPVLILGNKIDKKDAVGEKEIRQYFNLNGLTTGKGKFNQNEMKNRQIELFMCSVREREGYGEAFRWLFERI